MPDSSAGIKRKTIEDFFKAASDRGSLKYPRVEKRRIPTNIPNIPGLSLIDNFVSREEEEALLAFLDNQQWRTDLARRVIHYGGSYCLMPPRTATVEERKSIESNIITADPIPMEMDFVINRMIEDGIYQSCSRPTYCIVNEYRDNQGISAHVENFKFISPVCGLTLGHGDHIRFHELTGPDDGSVRSGKAAKAQRAGKKIDVWLPPRSLLAISGHARTSWQHEIVRSRKGRKAINWKRVSLTFRAELLK